VKILFVYLHTDLMFTFGKSVGKNIELYIKIHWSRPFWYRFSNISG